VKMRQTYQSKASQTRVLPDLDNSMALNSYGCLDMTYDHPARYPGILLDVEPLKHQNMGIQRQSCMRNGQPQTRSNKPLLKQVHSQTGALNFLFLRTKPLLQTDLEQLFFWNVGTLGDGQISPLPHIWRSAIFKAAKPERGNLGIRHYLGR
jgi:hypothetical protein